MAEVVICYSHTPPRLVRRIQCLATGVPGLIAVSWRPASRVELHVRFVRNWANLGVALRVLWRVLRFLHVIAL